MRKLHVGVIDLVTKAPIRTLYARVMHANLASIMPQVVALWCEQEGHDVTLECFTGLEDLLDFADDFDLVFIGAFTQSAQLAYSLSNYFRSKGAVTALGGPHARCYPQDAQKYFDYVLGFTTQVEIRDILQDCSQYRPIGARLMASQQPSTLPGVRERWKFMEPTLDKAPFVKIVPMLGSLGCPYTCSFCIDSVIDYQPFDFDVIKEDLRFLRTKFKRPHVGWHDPNFGIRFDDYMETIEAAIPPDSIDFVAESSLSLLSEPHMKRLKKNGFKALLPGIESWRELGNKSKTGKKEGMDKVHQVSEQINMIMEYVPYVQANFVLGLDSDEGTEPFDLTAKFLEICPGAFPAYSLLSAFGEAAPLNLEYQRTNRVLGFPFHFLNNNHAMNVRPKNYSWPEFYDNLIGLYERSFSWPAIYRRFKATDAPIPRWMNVVRAVSSEGFGRLKYYREIRRRLDQDPQFLPYFEQETDELPQFYIDRLRNDLGPLWEWLPEGALYHDHYAYMNSEQGALLSIDSGVSEQVSTINAEV
jgi:hypothetical protein